MIVFLRLGVSGLNFDIQGQGNDASGLMMNPEELLNRVVKKEDYDDGSSVFEFMDTDMEGNEQQEALASDTDFYANLAFDLSDSELKSIGMELGEEIRADMEARSEWENTNNLVLSYLGTKVEEFRKEPFAFACAAFDTTLLASLVRGFSVARAELFPAEGPCKVQINGITNTEIDERGERIKLFFNYYLTIKDKDYYPDSEQLLWYTLFFGSGFRKCYQDPVTGLPVARFIKPFDFIVNPNTLSLMSSNRMTEVCRWTSSYVATMEQKQDGFLEGSLPKGSIGTSEDHSIIQRTIDRLDGLDKESQDKKSLYEYYESHVMMNPSKVEKGRFKPEEDNDIERPYVIKMCAENSHICEIRRGWLENDPTFTRRDHFINYYMLKGFGIYGIGYAALAGTNAIALTSILRQTIDAGMIKNFPGGLRIRGTKSENNNITPGLGEFREIDTGGLPIQQAVMMMPYGEPSQVLMGLRSELKSEVQDIVNASLNAVPENNNNAPVGTTLAILEVADKVQSTILRSLHFALGNEFQLLRDLFAQYLPEEGYPFLVPGKEVVVMKQDFSDSINITPVSNPGTLTTAHRVIKAETEFKIASTNPQIHNMYEVYHRYYQSMNVENIDSLLPPPPKPVSADPISENMLVLSGKPITATFDQDHDSHILIKEPFANQMFQMNPQNPAIYTQLNINIQIHKAMKAVMTHQELQQMLGQDQKFMQMPPEEQAAHLLTIVMIQNIVAQEDAKKVLEQQQKAAQEQAQQVTPVQAMLAEIEQKREAAGMKEQETLLRAETEAFKAQLKFEGEKDKIETQYAIADEKNQVDLALAGIKLNQNSRGQSHE